MRIRSKGVHQSASVALIQHILVAGTIKVRSTFCQVGQMLIRVEDGK